jgi:hypothetical protein
MPESENLSAAWVNHMRAGAFEEAWKCSDKIVASGLGRDYHNIPRHFQSIWDGTPPDGKRVLVRCYHGLGDTIMFVRYAGMLKKIAGEIILWAQPSLIEVLTTVDGIDRILPLHDGIPEIEYDVDLEIMELPHLFRTTLLTIPANTPYIHVKPVYAGRKSDKLRVGLVWKAGEWDESRNIPFHLFTSLFGNEDLEFIILQDKAEQAGWSKGYGVHPGKCSLIEHARIMAGLDLMISADTMPAHLAGALGIPVWVLLPAKADWRWMENRSDSPWYPTMRLFRQKTPGDWSTVIHEISTLLSPHTTHP